MWTTADSGLEKDHITVQQQESSKNWRDLSFFKKVGQPRGQLKTTMAYHTSRQGSWLRLYFASERVLLFRRSEQGYILAGVASAHSKLARLCCTREISE